MTAAYHWPLWGRVRIFCVWLFLGVLFTALLASVGPLAIGDRSFTMRSGSMTPTLETGDVVVTEPIAPLAARVGQIVTFRDPEGSGKLFSHRVQSIRPAGDVVHFVTPRPSAGPSRPTAPSAGSSTGSRSSATRWSGRRRRRGGSR